MLIKEAKWIGRTLIKLSDEIEGVSMLNIGSSSLKFRVIDQPYVSKFIFSPFEENVRNSVKHIDLFDGVGVDINGDITSSPFISSLMELQYNTVLASNLLEHVQDLQLTVGNLISLIPPRGHLIVTGPTRFPYHPDPIDNLFRPSKAILASMFADLDLVDYKEVVHWNQHTGTQVSPFRKIRGTIGNSKIRNKLGGNAYSVTPSLNRVSAYCAHFQMP